MNVDRNYDQHFVKGVIAVVTVQVIGVIDFRIVVIWMRTVYSVETQCTT